MENIIKILSVIILMPWPMVFMMSPMMFPTESASNDIKNVRSILLILYYPCYIFLLYWIFGATLFGIKGSTLFLSSLVIVVAATSLFGYSSMFFNLSRGINPSGYTLTDNEVYLSGKLIKSADRETFVSVSGDFAISLSAFENNFTKDRNQVYYKGKVISHADPGSFEIIEKDLGYLARDKHALFYEDSKLEGADTNNYKLVSKTHIISNNNVYYNASKINNADANSFKVIEYAISKDSSRIYYNDKAILSEADPQSFELYSDDSDLSGYAKDKQFLHDPYTNTTYKDIDLETIKGFDRGYYTDKNHVYTDINRSLKILKGANPDTFTVTNWDEETQSDANDGTHYYINGEVVKRK